MENGVAVDADADDFECSITMELFAESGPNQPVFLPACGHTFSRLGIERLIAHAHARASPVACPLCLAPQPGVADAACCIPNWSLIKQLTGERRANRAAQPPAQQQDGENVQYAAHDGHAAQVCETCLVGGLAPPCMHRLHTMLCYASMQA